MEESVNTFSYKEVDTEGHETLDVIAEAENFNHWMYSTIKPYCKGRVLEVGSGVGNISAFFIQDGFKIYLTDIRDNYCAELKRKFSAEPNVIGVENIDLVDADFDTKYKHHLGSFDTVFALNVIEHIENDGLAIANCKKLLTQNGNLIILVPAYQWLYNNFDKELYHYRRYTAKRMSALFTKSEIQYFEEIKGLKMIIALWIAASLGFAIYVTISSDLYYFFISFMIGLNACQYTKILEPENE